MKQQHIVIVGGGVIGVGCANYLSKAGAQVTVIDKGRIGGGCSPASTPSIASETRRGRSRPPTALQRRGVPSRLVLFPDEGHWILKPPNRVVWWREVHAWLAKYLLPADSPGKAACR